MLFHGLDHHAPWDVALEEVEGDGSTEGGYRHDEDGSQNRTYAHLSPRTGWFFGRGPERYRALLWHRILI